MRRPLLSNTDIALKFLILGGIVAISAVIMTFAAVLIINFLYPSVNILGNSSLLENISNPDILHSLKIMQIINSISVFILPSLLFAFLFSDKTFVYLGFNKNTKLLSFLICCLVMFVSAPLLNWMAEINEYLKLPSFMSGVEQWMKSSEKEAGKITEVFLNVTTTKGLILNLFMIALIPAFGEELLFRGVLQNLLLQATKRKHLAIFISAFIFSFFHFQFYGFLPRFMMGLLFGYMFIWSNSLWLPICCHFVNNGSVVVISYLSTLKLLPPNIDEIGTHQNQYPIVIFSAVMVAYLVYVLYRIEKKNINNFISF